METKVKLETKYDAEIFDSLEEAKEWLNQNMEGKYYCKIIGVRKVEEGFLAQYSWAEQNHNVL